MTRFYLNKMKYLSEGKDFPITEPWYTKVTIEDSMAQQQLEFDLKTENPDELIHYMTIENERPGDFLIIEETELQRYPSITKGELLNLIKNKKTK